jgi:hypothetical protein
MSWQEDDYVAYDFSDDERVDSSDDEEAAAVKIMATGSRHEKDMILCGRSAAQCREQREQDWEEAMEDALDNLPDLTTTPKSSSEPSSKPSITQPAVSEAEAMEDGENAGDEDGPTPAGEEDELYDEEADAADEEWMKQQLASHYPHSTNIERPKPAAAPQSDAVLNCPACLTVVCIDCQRHDLYANQFRAMFVLNCKIMHDELLHVGHTQKARAAKKKKKRRKKTADNTDQPEQPLNTPFDSRSKTSGLPQDVVLTEDDFHPVQCTICTTEIAVLDRDEVFHFFNAIASLP